MTQSIVQAIIKKGSKTEKPWRRRCQPTASKIAKTTKFRAGTKYGHNGWSTTATCTISAWINNPFLSLTCRRTGKWRLKLFIDWGRHVLFLSIYYFKWSMNEQTIIEFGFCTDVETFMPSRLEFIFSYWNSYCMHGFLTLIGCFVLQDGVAWIHHSGNLWRNDGENVAQTSRNAGFVCLHIVLFRSFLVLL